MCFPAGSPEVLGPPPPDGTGCPRALIPTPGTRRGCSLILLTSFCFSSGKQFKCTVCDYTAAQKPQLLRHMEQHASFKVRAPGRRSGPPGRKCAASRNKEGEPPSPPLRAEPVHVGPVTWLQARCLCKHSTPLYFGSQVQEEC